MKFVKKKGPAPFSLFMTSETAIPRNASLTYAPPSETPPGTIQPDTMSVRLYDYDAQDNVLTPISPAVEYGEITGFEPVKIPANAATDPGAWWNYPHPDNLNNDSCAPTRSELRTAWTTRKYPDKGQAAFQSYANQMVRCESLRPPWGAFNISPAAEKAGIQEEAKKNATQVDAFQNNQFVKWLKGQAKKANITGAPLFAFLEGPEAFLAYAKQVGAVPKDAAIVPIGALALAVADSVIILSAMDEVGTQNAIYELSRVHGEEYGAKIGQMLSIFDASLSKSEQEAFAAKKAAIQFGGLLMAPGSLQLEKVRAKDSYSHRQGKRDRDARGARASTLAGIGFDQAQNDKFALNAEAIKDTIEDYLTCTTPGAPLSRPLHANQYDRLKTLINCKSDPNTWDAINGTALANALRSELSAQQGKTGKGPPPPATAQSFLPWALAGAGLLVGGPIGAAGGFAFGKALEKK